MCNSLGWAVSLEHLRVSFALTLWFKTLNFRGVSRYLIDHFNTLRPRQNGRHFADDTFKRTFLNKTFRISIKISLKFVPKGPIKNIPALVQIMAWRRSGDKPLSEPMMVRLLTHICVTRPQWVKWRHVVNSDVLKSLITKITTEKFFCQHFACW